MSARVRRAGAGLRVDVSRDDRRGGAGAALIRRTALVVLRAEGVRHAAISVALVPDARMRRLNTRFLRRRTVTDVIAFALPSGAGPVAGDIYIAPGAALRSAATHGIPVRNELVRLVVHGVLHVLGHDHPEGESRTSSTMWRRQEALVRRVLRTEAR